MVWFFLFFHADVYMRRHLRKGVPSLGADLSSVFEAEGAKEVGIDGDEEASLGRPAAVVTDAFDLRQHPVQQMVMVITKRWVWGWRGLVGGLAWGWLGTWVWGGAEFWEVGIGGWVSGGGGVHGCEGWASGCGGWGG